MTDYRFDLHIHSRHSHDCSVPVSDILDRAMALGLAGVAIADHDSFAGSAEALSRAPEELLVIPAAELATEYGHMLCYFIHRAPEAAGLERSGAFFRFEDVRRFVSDEGGLLFAAHPCRGSRFSEEILPQLDGIEVFNGRNTSRLQDANKRAMAMQRTHALPFSAGSDAHLLDEVGKAARIFRFAHTPQLDAVRDALARETSGAVYGEYLRMAPQARYDLMRHLRDRSYQRAARTALKAVSSTYYDTFSAVRGSTRALSGGHVYELEEPEP